MFLVRVRQLLCLLILLAGFTKTLSAQEVIVLLVHGVFLGQSVETLENHHSLLDDLLGHLVVLRGLQMLRL